MRRWLMAHQLGLLAYIARSLEAAAPQFDAVVKQLRLAALIDYESFGTEKWDRALRTLPPAVLAMMANVGARLVDDDEQLAEACAKARTVLRWLSPPPLSTKAEAPLHSAQSWAAHVLEGGISARWLARIGTGYFQGSWIGWNQRNSGKGHAVITKALAILRDPWAKTREKCSAITELARVLPRSPEWARTQIENSLYQQQFFWPLLVFGDGAVSLPIGVDVSFDGPYEGAQWRVLGREGAISIDDWEARVARWTATGKALWRAKHGNYGDFRDVIMSEETVVTFDFTVAQEIAEPLAECGFSSSTSLPLCDSSADAFFVQAVLQRLLGDSTSHGTAATGTIGSRHKDQDGAEIFNWDVDAPQGITAKLEYVFASHQFERVILPNGGRDETSKFFMQIHQGTETVSQLLRQSASVIHVPHLQKMADVMQVHGWRQFEYIRCPEIAALLHGEGRQELIDPFSEADPRAAEGRTVVEELRNQEHAVLSLSTRPEVVASALWHINLYERARLHKPPPMLSWTFVRTTHYEHDAKFWQVIWNSIGARSADFQDFLNCGTWEESAAFVANALNVFTPTKERPSHRAPDILVLIGSEDFAADAANSLAPRQREFLRQPILNVLSSTRKLNGPHDSRFKPLVGSTRIVLLPHPSVQPLALPLLNVPTKQALRALAVFEHEFTQGMAELVLNMTYSEVRDILFELKELGCVKTSVRGGFYIPQAVRQETLREATNDKAAAIRHFRAGSALAPYVRFSEIPGLSIDAAYAPEYAHEAGFHFEEAVRLAKRSRDVELFTICRVALQEHTRLTSLPTWGSVDRMRQSGSLTMYAWEMASELVERKSQRSGTIHPVNLIVAAQAATDRARDLGASHKSYNDLVRTAGDWCRQAIAACASFPSEREWLEPVVASYYADFLFGSDPNAALRIMEEVCTKMAAAPAMQTGTGPALCGKAFERAGDLCVDHAAAFRFYETGTRVAPGWRQLRVKAIGCAALCELDLTAIIAGIHAVDEVVLTLMKSAMAFHKQKRGPEHIVARWQAGLQEIRHQWRSYPKVVAAIPASG